MPRTLLGRLSAATGIRSDPQEECPIQDKILATPSVLRSYNAAKCDCDCGWATAPNPAGELTAFPQTHLVLKDYFWARRGKGKGEGEGNGK